MLAGNGVWETMATRTTVHLCLVIAHISLLSNDSFPVDAENYAKLLSPLLSNDSFPMTPSNDTFPVDAEDYAQLLSSLLEGCKARSSAFLKLLHRFGYSGNRASL